METSTRAHVGRASLEGGIERYARTFDLLEVVGERGRHPKRPGLLQWRRSVPSEFVFSVVIPGTIAAVTASPPSAELLAHAESVADALQASWWVLRTPPEVTPSHRAIRALSELCERLGAGGRRVAWEPRGVWSEEVALRTSEELGVSLVRDLAREDRMGEDPVVYTRLRALGEGARIGASAAERVAERLLGAKEAFVIVEGTGAGRVRKVLDEARAADAESDAGSDDEDESFDDEDELGEDPDEATGEEE